jgi:hypothetical protein
VTTQAATLPAHPKRAGLGLVLALVLLLLHVGAMIGIARQVQASRVTNTAMAATIGDLALFAATSALAEALSELTFRINRPGDALCEHLRQEVVPAPLTLVVDPRVCRRELSQVPLTREIQIQSRGVVVEFLPRRMLGMAPYEHAGRVRLSVTVSHSSTGIARRLVHEYDLRVNLLSTPRMFDQFSVCLLRPAPFLDPEANGRIDDTLRQLRGLRNQTATVLSKQVREFLERINDKLRELSRTQGISPQLYDVEALVRPLQPDIVPVAPSYSWDVRADYHYFVPDPILYSQRPIIEDLSRIYLVPRANRSKRTADASFATFRRELQYYNQIFGELRTLSAQQPVNPALAKRIDAKLKEYVASVKQLGAQLRPMAQDLLAVLEVYRVYTHEFPMLSPRDASLLRAFTPHLTPAYHAKKAQHLFEGSAAVDRVSSFLMRYHKAGERLQSCIYLNNQDQLLNLNRVYRGAQNPALRGKLVLATTGDLSLSGVTLADAREDLLTVCSGGRIHASGTVDASILATDLSTEPDLDLHGNLIISAEIRPERLRGRLDNSGFRYFSGVTGAFRGQYIHANFAPFPSVSTVERKGS